jgi:2-iminobutanoate/2-iminopropanoate deaminase
VRAGPFVFVSGQLPRDPATGRLVGDDVRSQTAQVFKNIRLVLGQAGLRLDDVVSVTVYLADIREWDAFNTEFREIFKPPFPSRTVVGAQLHDVLIEASAVAYRTD